MAELTSQKATQLMREAAWEMEVLLAYINQAVNTLLDDPEVPEKGRLFFARGLVQRAMVLSQTLMSDDDALDFESDIRGWMPKDINVIPQGAH